MHQEDNLFGLIATSLHPESLAAFFRGAGWRVRQVSEYGDYEVENASCKLTIENNCGFLSDLPLHMHGFVPGTSLDAACKHTDEMLIHLQKAGVAYAAWLNGPTGTLSEFIHNCEIDGQGHLRINIKLG